MLEACGCSHNFSVKVCQMSRIFCQKSPIFYQKSPIFTNRAPCSVVMFTLSQYVTVCVAVCCTLFPTPFRCKTTSGPSHRVCCSVMQSPMFYRHAHSLPPSIPPNHSLFYCISSSLSLAFECRIFCQIHPHFITGALYMFHQMSLQFHQKGPTFHQNSPMLFLCCTRYSVTRPCA